MTSPLETMEWLAAQFRDRANDDPEPHTEKDASEVSALRTCFLDMIAALRRDLWFVQRAGPALHYSTASADDDLVSDAQERGQAILSLIDHATGGAVTENADDIADPRIEPMARALERARHPEWADDEFAIWWSRDPHFTVQATNWFHFGPGTRKQHVFWEAEQCLSGMPGYRPARPAPLRDMGGDR